MSRVPGYLSGVELWGLGSLGQPKAKGKARGRRGWKQYASGEQQAQMDAFRTQRRAARKEFLSQMAPEERVAWKAARKSKRKARREARKAKRAASGKPRRTRSQRAERWASMTDEQRQARTAKRFQKWQSRHQDPTAGFSGYIWY